MSHRPPECPFGHRIYACGVDDVSQSVDLGRSNNPNTTPTKDYEMCKWWFTSAVSREDVLRRGRGDLHQQGDADRDTGYSWGTGAIEDKGGQVSGLFL